jgi:hypothetical protein
VESIITHATLLQRELNREVLVPTRDPKNAVVHSYKVSDLPEGSDGMVKARESRQSGQHPKSMANGRRSTVTKGFHKVFTTSSRVTARHEALWEEW